MPFTVKLTCFLEKIIKRENPTELKLSISLFDILNDEIFNNSQDEIGGYPYGRKTAGYFMFGETKISTGDRNSEIVDKYLLKIFELYYDI